MAPGRLKNFFQGQTVKWKFPYLTLNPAQQQNLKASFIPLTPIELVENSSIRFSIILLNSKQTNTSQKHNIYV